MTNAIRGVLTVLLVCLGNIGFTQDKPSVEKPEDLRKLVKGAGFNEDLFLSFKGFVQFGSYKVAKKFSEGDQFDRLEIKKEGKAHQDKLRKKQLRFDGLRFNVVERDDVETKGLVARLDLPMRVRGGNPFYKDIKSFSGALAAMHPTETNPIMVSFLTKDKTLRQCTLAEAAILKENNGVLYNPEVANTTLILLFKDKLGILKDISRNQREYSVEIEFTDLSRERPRDWGYFRMDALIDSDWDCQKLWDDNLQDLKNPQPAYFITAFGKEDDAKIPEIVRCSLFSLRVLTKTERRLAGTSTRQTSNRFFF